MAVRVFIRRRVPETRVNGIIQLFRRLRRKALDQEGYISGETIRSLKDPEIYIVISSWQTPEDWTRWTESPERKEIQDNKTKEARALLNTLRIGAMNQPGYISGETLFNQYDPKCIMVISIWQTVDDWEKWKESDERSAIEAQFEILLQEPAEYEAFEVVSTNLWKFV